MCNVKQLILTVDLKPDFCTRLLFFHITMSLWILICFLSLPFTSSLHLHLRCCRYLLSYSHLRDFREFFLQLKDTPSSPSPSGPRSSSPPESSQQKQHKKHLMRQTTMECFKVRLGGKLGRVWICCCCCCLVGFLQGKACARFGKVGIFCLFGFLQGKACARLGRVGSFCCSLVFFKVR